MPDITRKRAIRKLDAEAIARSCLEIGLQPVPLFPKSKRPKGGKRWHKLRVTVEDIPDHFNKGDNVGVVWGEPSNGVIDVDVDWDEASVIASDWLPETFTYGRLKRPCTHYCYTVKNLKTYKWTDPGGSVIVEIRSTGTQSVFPPSIHPTGDRYAIDHDSGFTTISGDALRRRCSRLAGIALLARHYPDTGSRHDYIHAFVGALLHSGWAPDDARKAGMCLLSASGDTEIEQRKRTIENTITHDSDGDQTYGWPTLAQYVDKRVIDRAKNWLTKEKVNSEPPDSVDTILDSDYRLPSGFMKPPGIVGDIARWSARSSYLRQPIFDIAVGLMCTALATGNRYEVESWATPLQPYFMLSAPTAGGKESALSAVYEFARRNRLREAVIAGSQSYHALLDRIGQEPHIVCWLWDEAGRKLQSASRSPSSPDFQVMSWLLSLYGKANSSMPGMPGRNHNIEAVDYPYLTIMAATQPNKLIDALSASDLTTGVINRFVLFDAGDDAAVENLERRSVFPAELESRVKAMIERPRDNSEHPFVQIKFESKIVKDRFIEFSRFARIKCANPGLGEMWGRANQNALVIAGICAAGIDCVITMEIADWALGFINWTLERWETRLDRGVNRSRTEGASKAIEDLIRRAKSIRTTGLSKQQISLLKRGLMTRTVLIRHCRYMNAIELDRILETLVDSEIAETNEVQGNAVYWIRDARKH